MKLTVAKNMFEIEKIVLEYMLWYYWTWECLARLWYNEQDWQEHWISWVVNEAWLNYERCKERNEPDVWWATMEELVVNTSKFIWRQRRFRTWKSEKSRNRWKDEHWTPEREKVYDARWGF